MIFLGEIAKFKNKLIHELTINDISLLLIQQHNQFHLIENKCGHFGLPLITGKVKDEEIICSHHGISFNLLTGEVVNRPYENCDMIRVFKIVEKNMGLYVEEPID
jgi:nitrite reductase/ring-hydroxylating ferredoxin subunit